MVARYPSHLHIDLLPRGQGQGHGRLLIESLLDLLRAGGSGGVHLGVSPTNLRAQRLLPGASGSSSCSRPGRASLFMGRGALPPAT